MPLPHDLVCAGVILGEVDDQRIEQNQRRLPEQRARCTDTGFRPMRTASAGSHFADGGRGDFAGEVHRPVPTDQKSAVRTKAAETEVLVHPTCTAQRILPVTHGQPCDRRHEKTGSQYALDQPKHTGGDGGQGRDRTGDLPLLGRGFSTRRGGCQSFCVTTWLGTSYFR